MTGLFFLLVVNDDINNICYTISNIVRSGTVHIFLLILDEQWIFWSLLIISLVKRIFLHYKSILVPHGNQGLMANLLEKVLT